MAIARKLPKRENLRRQTQTKNYNAVILIVTEGEKTEPIYFKGMRKYERLESSKIDVVQSDYGTSPLDVVNYAIDRKKANHAENRRSGEPKFDRIYCVIDRDDHTNYLAAIDKGRANNIDIIRSIPCFEIWYLLHFSYTTRVFDKRPVLLREIRKYIPGYDKTNDLYTVLKPKLKEAIGNAKKLISMHSQICNPENEHPNPLTDVHALVSHLLKETL